MTELSTAELRENFDHFDTDNDGKLELGEFKQLMAALDADGAGEDAALGFRAIDSDGSGLVEFDEFATWFGAR